MTVNGYTHSMEARKKFWIDGIRYTGITFGVYAAMRWLLPYVIPFLVALFLAKWIHPLLQKIKNKKGKKLVGALVLTLLFVSIVLAFAAGMYGLTLLGQGFAKNCEQWIASGKDFWETCCCQLEALSGLHLDRMEHFFSETAGSAGEQIRQSLLQGLMGWSAKSVRQILSWLGIFIVVAVSSFYILHDYEGIRKRASGSAWGSFLVGLGRKVLGTLGVYLRTQCVIISVVSAVCVAALMIGRVRWAVWIGAAIGICDALPFLGTGTIFIPWALVELLLGNYLRPALFLATYLVCTFLREILEPRLMGNRLELHPVAVMMSIYIGLCVYGISGVILGPVSLILIKEIGKSPFLC